MLVTHYLSGYYELTFSTVVLLYSIIVPFDSTVVLFYYTHNITLFLIFQFTGNNVIFVVLNFNK